MIIKLIILQLQLYPILYINNKSLIIDLIHTFFFLFQQLDNIKLVIIIIIHNIGLIHHAIINFTVLFIYNKILLIIKILINWGCFITFINVWGIRSFLNIFFRRWRSRFFRIIYRLIIFLWKICLFILIIWFWNIFDSFINNISKKCLKLEYYFLSSALSFFFDLVVLAAGGGELVTLGVDFFGGII